METERIMKKTTEQTEETDVATENKVKEMVETMAEMERIMKKTTEQIEETDVEMENITDSYQNRYNTHQTDGKTIPYML
jgi:phosphoribosyl-ATP pyrophosphohydrolase